MRWVLVAISISACAYDDRFTCADSSQCRLGSDFGVCEASLQCSFPDPACPTGRRYRNADCVEDVDNDTIADDGDNCPGLANTDQLDEDSDHVGDRCDPCPVVAENARGAGDTDGDGVGNLCDPHPLVKGDSLVLFEGFVLPLAAGWVNVGPASQQNGALVLGDTVLTVPELSGGSETLSIEMTWSAMPSYGTWLGMPYDAGVGVYCYLTESMLELWTASAASSPQLSSTPYATTIDTKYVVSIQRTTTSYKCSARGGSLLVPPGETTGQSTNVPTRQAIVIGTDTVTRLGWVMLVRN